MLGLKRPEPPGDFRVRRTRQRRGSRHRRATAAGRGCDGEGGVLGGGEEDGGGVMGFGGVKVGPWGLEVGDVAENGGWRWG